MAKALGVECEPKIQSTSTLQGPLHTYPYRTCIYRKSPSNSPKQAKGPCKRLVVVILKPMLRALQVFNVSGRRIYVQRFGALLVTSQRTCGVDRDVEMCKEQARQRFLENDAA